MVRRGGEGSKSRSRTFVRVDSEAWGRALAGGSDVIVRVEGSG